MQWVFSVPVIRGQTTTILGRWILASQLTSPIDLDPRDDRCWREGHTRWQVCSGEARDWPARHVGRWASGDPADLASATFTATWQSVTPSDWLEAHRREWPGCDGGRGVGTEAVRAMWVSGRHYRVPLWLL